MYDKLKTWAQLLQSWKVMKDWAWDRFQDSGSFDDFCRYIDIKDSARAVIEDARKEGIYLV